MPSNVSITGDDALTLDMVNQYVYCPRRFHLMYVEGRWEDNAYTVEGRHVHRRVDQVDHVLAPPTEPPAPGEGLGRHHGHQHGNGADGSFRASSIRVRDELGRAERPAPRV